MKIMNILVLSTLFAVSNAKADYILTEEDTCVTKQTGANGKRRSCGMTACVTAGFREYISDFHAVELHHRGTGSGCGEAYIAESLHDARTKTDYPIKVCVKGNARSYKGTSSGRGRVTCKIEATVVQ